MILIVLQNKLQNHINNFSPPTDFAAGSVKGNFRISVLLFYWKLSKYMRIKNRCKCLISNTASSFAVNFNLQKSLQVI
jgi:hypothetical protein